MKKTNKKESWTCWQWVKCKSKKLNKNHNKKIDKLNMRKLWWINNNQMKLPCKTNKIKMMNKFQENNKWMNKKMNLMKKLMKNKRNNSIKISDWELKCLRKCHIHHHSITHWSWLIPHLKVGWCTFHHYWTPQLLNKLEINSWKLFTHSLKLKIRIICGSVGSIWKWF